MKGQPRDRFVVFSGTILIVIMAILVHFFYVAIGPNSHLENRDDAIEVAVDSIAENQRMFGRVLFDPPSPARDSILDRLRGRLARHTQVYFPERPK